MGTQKANFRKPVPPSFYDRIFDKIYKTRIKGKNWAKILKMVFLDHKSPESVKKYYLNFLEKKERQTFGIPPPAPLCGPNP